MMSMAHRDVLRKNRLELLKILQIDSEFMFFFQRDMTLTDEMCAEITEPPNYTRRERVTKLIDILPTRGAVAFECLIEALVETNQEHLAGLLDPTNARLRFVDNVDSAENVGTTNADVLAQRITSYFEDKARNNPAVQLGTSNKLMAEKIKKANKIYKMTEVSHGKALIVSFPGDSNKDAILLKTLFKGLGFEPEIISSPATSEALLVNLKDEAEEISNDDEALVLVFLGCPVNFPTTKVQQIFNGNKCENLKKKPVLFFLQKFEGAAAMEVNNDTADSAVTGSAEGSQHRLTVSWTDKRHRDGVSEAVACLVFTFAELARYLNLNDLLYMVSSVLDKLKYGARLERDSTLEQTNFYFLYPSVK